ncbi:cyclic nucleotide-binding domain-containing protein [Pseudanabaena sp. FACHB-1998]|uniref:cyclic nucleotide-binding domain-containing protein n=1 Tax=Pseudanabaena sp. FACHB-1998 TaxID=2692858 RepID=UPI001680BAB1|nr:cyclic nucleotide-binding domain-containing protein [Pseudanabaena sp. FACHB-1998]MBD2179210.1 cyclic nucleotide-binding domain-containing protein [Pseudanabaena sp. FACHB-1998]
MTEFLLKELTNNDIDWMIATGQQLDIAPDTQLIEQGRVNTNFFVLLEGDCISTIASESGNIMGRAFAALENVTSLDQKLEELGIGEIFGESAFLGVAQSAVSVKATTKSKVLKLSHQAIYERMEQDNGFGARFYHALASHSNERCQRIIPQYLSRKLGFVQSMMAGGAAFGELSDGDVDWLLKNGKIEVIPEGQVFIQAGRPVEFLFVLLNAVCAVSAFDKPRKMSRIFASLESGSQSEEAIGAEIIHLTTGEITGETTFVNLSPISAVATKTLKESVFLAIPYPALQLELQKNLGFASRFYRMLSILITSKTEALIERMGYGKRRSYDRNQSLQANVLYEDELDDNSLDNLTLAGARFDWMLKRLSLRGNV